jgi:hypothetical protein
MTLVLPNKVLGPQSVELASAYSVGTPGLPNDVLGHIFHFFNAEELARIVPVCRLWNTISFSDAVSYGIPFPAWIKDIDAGVWEKYVDVKKYGLDLSKVPRVNRRVLTKALKPLARKVENKMGITNMVIPKGLTLKIVLQIAKDNSVPIWDIWDKILTHFGDIAVEQTGVLFFTNSIFESTRLHTPKKRKIDMETIGKECGIAIQMHEIRNFMAFLVLTYLNSPEDARTMLYSSNTYTRLIEKVNNRLSLIVGFSSFGLYADHISLFDPASIGVGASGCSEDNEAMDIET